ncbi:alkaline phosphatase family protein [Planktothrix sp. FACHB-1355]|uniref:Alkaline phosphatase family protein n=1 Tax=Aerosakkonema funiforme FACHB-1375 TaxID=2949571 RepID=A0A926VIC6_9CYAN|nr:MULTISPECIES: alkaline phosphatase family protein [Oscillatoriales]MBD2183267.1 alkaline phosphatase family protein [Aerosakkonema funiforme FACHB-1375]MBD3560743.1 alkaline phosphatase family protein [Planktothrix sp. FACHB-1355]
MNKVLMIGLDGGTFTLLKPLIEEGVMPFLKEFLSDGVNGDLISTLNPLTPPAWVSIYTGRSPEVHGIFDFMRSVAGDGKIVMFRPNNFEDIRCETIWSMISRHGKRVTTLNFFGMSPPQAVNGYLVSGFTTWKHLRSATYPPSLFETMKNLPNFDYKKLGMDIQEEKKAIWGLQEGKYEEWIKMHLERDKSWTDLLCYLMETDPTDLTAIVFDGPDKLQHLFWRYLLPELAENNLGAWDSQIRELCLQYYRQLDDSIERLVRIAGLDTNVIMVSDHGFGSSTEVVYMNEWLAQNGYLKWSEAAEIDPVGRIASDRSRDNKAMMMLDWNNTIAYAKTASSNGIFVKDVNTFGVGITDEEYVEFCTKLRQELLDYRHPVDGGQVFVNVYLNQARMEGKQSVESAPDLTVKLRDGGFVSILRHSEIVRQRKKPEGTHRPNGIFAARGPAIKSGEQLKSLSILDISPLLLYLLDLPVPTDLEGRVPTEILRDEKLINNPVELYGVTQLLEERTNQQEQQISDEEKEALLAQLKLLGYME